jgi:signal transduction histidine kinase
MVSLIGCVPARFRVFAGGNQCHGFTAGTRKNCGRDGGGKQMPSLRIKKSSGQQTKMALVEPSYSIGRASDNQIVLEGAGVSRRHGVIHREGDDFSVSDLDSYNGIFVNGKRVKHAVLKHNDEIRVGTHTIVYSEEEKPIPVSDMTVTLEEDYDRLVQEIASGVRRGPAQDSDLAASKERRTLRLLFDLSRALSEVRSLEDVSRKAVEILLSSTQAEQAAIFLLDEEGATLRPAVIRRHDEAVPDAPSGSLSSTIAQRIMNDRKAIISADAGTDPRFAHGHSVVLQGLRSIVCAPLVGKSGVLGILYLENNRAIGAFTHDDLSLLCAVASQISLSVENARFFDAIKRANEELELEVVERTAALRQAELKLYQHEKMASLSRLVAGIAHEVNSPLGALKANLELLMVMFGRLATTEGRPPDESKLLRHLIDIAHESVSACSRIVRVVRSLISFARLDESEFKVVNVNDGLTATVQVLDPSVQKRIDVVLNLGDIPALPCYPALLNEAFMNLLTNACQAIKEKGQVFIDTRREGDDVVISIRDTGSGIPAEHLDKIFDPGFTTKGVGVGVGLGLAVAYSVIKEHQGSIQVSSQLGQGSTFTIRLPINQDPGLDPRSYG